MLYLALRSLRLLTASSGVRALELSEGVIGSLTPLIHFSIHTHMAVGESRENLADYHRHQTTRSTNLVGLVLTGPGGPLSEGLPER